MMMGMNAKQPFGMPPPALQDAKYPGLHAGSEAVRRVCLQPPQVGRDDQAPFTALRHLFLALPFLTGPPA